MDQLEGAFPHCHSSVPPHNHHVLLKPRSRSTCAACAERPPPFAHTVTFRSFDGRIQLVLEYLDLSQGCPKAPARSAQDRCEGRTPMATLEATFGLSGFTSMVRVLGITTRSMSSMGMALINT